MITHCTRELWSCLVRVCDICMLNKKKKNSVYVIYLVYLIFTDANKIVNFFFLFVKMLSLYHVKREKMCGNILFLLFVYFTRRDCFYIRVEKNCANLLVNFQFLCRNSEIFVCFKRSPDFLSFYKPSKIY